MTRFHEKFLLAKACITSKLRIHGAEGVNATGIKLLDRFGRIQAPDRKGAMGKDRRKSRDTTLCPETPNEPGVEWRTKWKPQLVLR